MTKSSTAPCVTGFLTVWLPALGTMWSQNITLILSPISVTCVIRFSTLKCSSTIISKQSIRKSKTKWIDIKKKCWSYIIDHLVNPGCQFQDPSELLQFVSKKLEDGRFHCILCDKFSHANSSCTRNHVESHHYPNIFSYQCDLCDQICSTRTKLNTHKQLKHKKNKQPVAFMLN